MPGRQPGPLKKRIVTKSFAGFNYSSRPETFWSRPIVKIISQGEYGTG